MYFSGCVIDFYTDTKSLKCVLSMKHIFVNLQNIFIYWFKADGFLKPTFLE